MAASKTAGCGHLNVQLVAYLPSAASPDSTTISWCPSCGALNYRRFDGKRWRDAWAKAKRPR